MLPYWRIHQFAMDFRTVIGGNPTGSGGTGGLNYSWSPGNGLSGINKANPTATPVSTTTYCVVVSDSLGCFGIGL